MDEDVKMTSVNEPSAVIKNGVLVSGYLSNELLGGTKSQYSMPDIGYYVDGNICTPLVSRTRPYFLSEIAAPVCEKGKKMLEYTNMIVSQQTYHHGEESLTEAINKMSRDFPALYPVSSFGTRYIFTEASLKRKLDEDNKTDEQPFKLNKSKHNFTEPQTLKRKLGQTNITDEEPAKINKSSHNITERYYENDKRKYFMHTFFNDIIQETNHHSDTIHVNTVYIIMKMYYRENCMMVPSRKTMVDYLRENNYNMTVNNIGHRRLVGYKICQPPNDDI
jgi:hypothetical protein